MRNESPSRLDRVGRPVDERQRRVALAHPAHHLSVDLLGRIGDPDDIVQIARPLGRAHADMSACDWSLQRPPRSRASPSRTSCQT